MNNSKFKITLFFLFFYIPFFAQNFTDAKKVMDKVTAVYGNSKRLSFFVEYASFSNYKDIKPKELYSGILIKNGDVYYNKIKNTEIINFSDCSLKIGNDEKAIMYNANQKEDLLLPSLESSAFLKEFSGKLKSTPSHYICEFIPKKFTQIMVSKIIFYINKKDFTLAKQIMYLAQETEYKNSGGKVVSSAPRVELTFQKRKNDTEKDKFLTKKENYFTKRGVDVILSKRLLGYKLYKL